MILKNDQHILYLNEKSLGKINDKFFNFINK